MLDGAGMVCVCEFMLSSHAWPCLPRPYGARRQTVALDPGSLLLVERFTTHSGMERQKGTLDTWFHMP